VLIDVVLEYSKSIRDNYETTIPLKHKGIWISPEELTILGDKIYVTSRPDILYIVCAETYKIVQIIQDNRIENLNCYVKDYLTQFTKDNKIVSDEHDMSTPKFKKRKLTLPSFSGYFPNNDNLIENFWHLSNRNSIAYTDKYMIICKYGTNEISVYDKKKNIYITNIKEKINYNYYTKRIIVWSNELYIFGFIKSDERVFMTFNCYIHVYDIETFEFVREFRNMLNDSQQEYNATQFPTCIAFKDNKIFIGLTNGGIEVWSTSDVY
jgi:hypothetical protein